MKGKSLTLDSEILLDLASTGEKQLFASWIGIANDIKIDLLKPSPSTNKTLDQFILKNKKRDANSLSADEEPATPFSNLKRRK